MSAPCRVSVVIPTYNRRDYVQQLLCAMKHQTLPAAEFEVIVSIDGSDDTRETVNQSPAPYRLFGPDYFFWLGAFSAIRENRRTGQGLTALPKLANPCKR